MGMAKKYEFYYNYVIDRGHIEVRTYPQHCPILAFIYPSLLPLPAAW